MLISTPTFGDARLSKRLNRILAQLSLKSEESVPRRIKDRSQVKAYYRFINNKEVNSEMLIDAYRRSSLEASRAYSGLILSIQDTTELVYTGKRSSAHLGPLSHEFRRGMLLHNHLLLRSSGSPLGIFSQRFQIRDPADFGKRLERKFLPFEEKESYRWLAEYRALESAFASWTARQVLCICDRGGDIHELLEARTLPHVHYLIRSRTDRKMYQQSGKIYEKVAGQPLQFRYELELPPRKKEPARRAELSVRYTPVEIHPGYRSKAQKQLTPVAVNLIEVKEEEPPQGIDPICWRLLTSMPIENDEQVAQLIQYYVLRWVIERFHYVLKQGFNIEHRQVEEPQALKNAIVLDSWPAVQICATHYLAQTQPEIPATEMGVKPSEFRLLVAFLAQRYNIKFDHSDKPTIRELHRLWAIFGGFQNQRNKSPGMVTLWRGWKECELILQVRRIDEDVGNQ